VLVEQVDPDTGDDGPEASARDQLVARVQGVVFGQQYLMLDYDCPRSVLDDATAITPGLESPTIAPLANPDWVAVRALVPRRGVNEIMDELVALGAKAILASDIRFCRF
jgi:ATP phosphoribosyltransferase